MKHRTTFTAGAPVVLLAGSWAASLTSSAGARSGGGTATQADVDPKLPHGADREEQAKTFVPARYRWSLVLSDPKSTHPRHRSTERGHVRAEFVTYMPDVKAPGRRPPAHSGGNTNADGKSTNAGVRDKLPAPDGPAARGRQHYHNATPRRSSVTDTNGDGVADKREVFYTGVGIGRDGNLEHEQSGFVWGLDNWIYSTYNSFRFRWTPTGIVREPTGSNGGQWGLTQDDDGKMWFVCAGCERGPVNFQVRFQYGAYDPDEYEPDSTSP